MLDSEQAAYLVGGADIETHQGSGVLLLKGLVLVTDTCDTPQLSFHSGDQTFSI